MSVRVWRTPWPRTSARTFRTNSGIVERLHGWLITSKIRFDSWTRYQTSEVRMKLLTWIIGLLAAAMLMVAGAQSTRTAKVTVTPPTEDTEGNPLNSQVFLNYYQSVNGGAFVKVVSRTTDAVRTFTGLPPGQVCYKVSAETAVHPEGAQSDAACKTFPFPGAGKPAVAVE